MKLQLLTLCAMLSIQGVIEPVHVTLQQHDKNKHEKSLTINFELAAHEMVLKKTINITSNSPHTKLTGLNYSQNATKHYLAEYKDSKDVFTNSFTITTTASTESPEPNKTKLYISYMALPESKTKELAFDINWNQNVTSSTDMQMPIAQKSRSLQTEQLTQKSYLESFQNVVETTDNNWIRLLFALLLGLLLSLTPCIYPMIPITIGILHRHGKKSLLHNFLGALCYAIGLSTTFAILGLLAAFAGASFGGLLSQPIFVIILTLFIGFMSLSMIGIIDLPIPSFMQGGTDINSSSLFGPFLSAYIFGLISGSIASPCVSPGLALLLTIVATMGDIVSGFLLLFAFGMGMSIPLMIIGTFSTSLQMLPQAGQWMVEVKKLLGFGMLATCFYYLSNILPSHMVMWLFVAYLLFASLFYIIDAQKSFDDKSKTIKSLIGIILLALTIFTAYRAYEGAKPQTAQEAQEKGVVWADDYISGLAQARSQNKLLILDFWAQHCTICKAIEKKLFDKSIVAQGLDPHIIFIKVDCTSSSNEEANMLKKKYNVIAQPAILIIDPHNEKIIKKWSSEPYNMSPQEFVQNVKKLKQ